MIEISSIPMQTTTYALEYIAIILGEHGILTFYVKNVQSIYEEKF